MQFERIPLLEEKDMGAGERIYFFPEEEGESYVTMTGKKKNIERGEYISFYKKHDNKYMLAVENERSLIFMLLDETTTEKLHSKMKNYLSDRELKNYILTVENSEKLMFAPLDTESIVGLYNIISYVLKNRL